MYSPCNIKKVITALTLFLFFGVMLFSQSGSIKGRVFNSINNQAIPFAVISLDSNKVSVTSDINGEYKVENLDPGTYNISCDFVGFKRALFYEIGVGSARVTTLDIAMEEEATALEAVNIKAASFNKTAESPLSMRTINATEIYRNPGGNRDVSKVIQILPGVGSSGSFRNDISGGPVGMINVNFIRELDFYAGAFPVNRGNAMSSVLDFKQITGNDEKISGTFQLGSSDAGLTLDGPMGKKSTFLFSARRSYLQFLFKAIGLPFLPTYNDFQYKQVVKVNEKNQFTLLGLGAIDDFVLNLDANDGISDPDQIERNNFTLDQIPVNSQWNYAAGINWRHFSEKSYQNYVFSRNHLNNKATKYRNNTNLPEDLLLFYSSQEVENKFRFENTKRINGWKWNAGAGFENVNYTNSTFNRIQVNGQTQLIDFDSKLGFNKFALFTQIGKKIMAERLSLSFGVRTDFNDYSSDMSNPLDQLSPRFSASYAISSKWSFNFNAGRYFQLPAYTVMGYRDGNNELVNKDNNLTYISSDHLVAGIEFNPTRYAKVTVEGFLKSYSNYPFLLRDSISLANLGGDFGVIGNEPATSISEGRTSGIEVLVQQKLSSSIYGILSYTYVNSEFKDKDGEYVPSAWDNEHIFNLTAGKKFKKNWEAGLKFRLLGGNPYTPYNTSVSSLQSVWDVTQGGVFDWNLLNSERNDVSHGLDIRIDKKWFFEKWSVNLYLDIQNLYNFQITNQPFLAVRKDDSGNPIVDPNDPLRYELFEIENTNGTRLPSLGLMIEF